MIMKRTRKNDDGKLESPGSPSKSVVTPPKQVTPTVTPPQLRSPMEETVLPLGTASPPGEVTPDKTPPGETTDSVRPQKLPLSSVTRDDVPKFKSPLLQHILGGRTRPKAADKNEEQAQQQQQEEESGVEASSPDQKPSEDAVSPTHVEVDVSPEDTVNMAEKARNFVESVVSKVTESMQGKSSQVTTTESEHRGSAPALELSSAEPASELVKRMEKESVSAPEPVMEPTSKPATEPALKPVVEPTPEPLVEPASESAVEAAPEPVLEPISEPTVKPASEPVTASEPSKDLGLVSAGLKPSEEAPVRDMELRHEQDTLKITHVGDETEAGSEPSKEAVTLARAGAGDSEDSSAVSIDKTSFIETDQKMVTDEDKDIDTSFEASDMLNNSGYSMTTTTTTRTVTEVIQEDSNRLMNGYTVKDIEILQSDRYVCE